MTSVKDGVGREYLDIRRYRALVGLPVRITMLKHFFGLSAAIMVMTFSTYAEAVCVCQCIEGQVQAACTSSLDIPPICQLRTCPFAPSLVPPPIGYRSSCGPAQSCDIYGHCVWTQICQGDTPSTQMPNTQPGGMFNSH
jgi:hypothetical protein